ncbi:MAG: hypothetical protein K0Q51_1592 [Rickettsiaceae bacterium]|jgi:putative PIN family toxin of toxin-antitoxin system|nr:hypothetical protein [Rickettsiaceae bacterium]
MKIVTDCNVIIAAGLTAGTSRQALNIILSEHQNFISDDIIREYRDVIVRDKFKKYKSQLIELVENVCICSTWIEQNPKSSNFIIPDPADIMYLDLALEVGAKYLITGNLKDFPEKQYNQVTILSPREFIDIVK